MGLDRAFAPAEREFAKWRKKRRRGGRIPEELWQLAVELASQHGVARTSTSLRLGYYALKERLEEREEGDIKKTGHGDAFVELPMPAVAESTACSIELRDAAGTQLTLRFEDANVVDVAAIGPRQPRRLAIGRRPARHESLS